MIEIIETCDTLYRSEEISPLFRSPCKRI